MADTRREWTWAALGLLAIVALVVLMAPPPSQVAMDYRLSTLRTTPDGAQGLYETLESLGVSVDRRMTPLAGVDSIRGPLAILEPVEYPSPTELDSLFAWVERGGRLIVSPPLHYDFEQKLGLVLFRSDTIAPRVGERHPWTAGIDSFGAAEWTFRPDTVDGPAVTPLVVDSVTGETIVGVFSRGAGRILAISDGQLLSNGEVVGGGIAPIVARAASDWTRSGGTLWFDEYHHGQRGGSPYRALARILVQGGIGKAAVQLILVALLALVPAAVRFGAPRPAGPEPRRSRLEHVDALGEVYRQAEAAELARRRLIAGFARRIGRDRPLPGEEATFLDRLARAAPTGAGAAGAVLDALNRNAPVDELAKRIDDAVLQLNRAP